MEMGVGGRKPWTAAATTASPCGRGRTHVMAQSNHLPLRGTVSYSYTLNQGQKEQEEARGHAP